MSETQRKKTRSRKLRARSRLGKYRIEACLSEGAYSNVYRAFDTIENRYAALKIPHQDLADEEFLESFRKEVRLSAKIDSPRIVGIKDASFIDGLFVMAYPLGTESLSERLSRRISSANMNILLTHAIAALAEVHAHKVIHCDIKPDNFIIFPWAGAEVGRPWDRAPVDAHAHGAWVGVWDARPYGAGPGDGATVGTLGRVRARAASTAWSPGGSRSTRLSGHRLGSGASVTAPGKSSSRWSAGACS